MRLILLLLLLSAALTSRAADVLVLISAKDAGPTVPVHDYIHPCWVLWPAASDSAGSNRMMSIPTGMDWKPEPTDGNFRTDGPFPLPVDANLLSDRGYFQAVAAHLGDIAVAVVAEKQGGYSPDVLRAGLTKPLQIPSAPFKGPFPDQLLIASVSGPHAWDDLADLTRRAGGRVLVVELPQGDDLKWSRVWLRGAGWPVGLPSMATVRVPGLVPARNLLDLLHKPEGFQWTPNDTQKWGAANRWLEYGHFTAPVFLVFVAVVAIYVAGCAVFAIVREERGRVALFMLRLLALGPAILVLAGRLTAHGFANGWPGWLALATVILCLAAFGLNLLFKRGLPETHPLIGEMLVGFAVLLDFDPVWSVLSGTIGPRFTGLSPEALGVLCAYMCGAIAILLPGSHGRASSVIVGLVSAFWISLMPAQWEDLRFIWVLINCVAIVATYPRALAFVTACGIPVLIWLGKIRNGLTYAPRDLYPTYAASKALNLADHVAFVSSPTFIGFTLLVVVVWIAGDKFFTHQVKRSLAMHRQPLALIRASLAYTTLGLFWPPLLYAGLACAMGAAVVILFDTVRS